MLQNFSQKFNSIGDQIMREFISFIKFIITLILFTTLLLIALLFWVATTNGWLPQGSF